MNLENVLLNVIGGKKYSELELSLAKSNKTVGGFFKSVAILFGTLTVIVITLFSLGYFDIFTFLIVLLLGIPAITFVLYLLENLKEEQRQKTIDSNLQDVLLQASLFPKGTEITKILEYISNQKYKYISTEFKIALKHIQKGISVSKALQEITTRNKSKMLGRVINLLIIGYKSGKEMSFVFSKISHYILKTQELERERYSSLAIQKYTLLISSAILVPLILSWVVNIVGSMDLSSFSALGVITQDPNMALYAKYATWIYIVELSLISSFFIAMIDGNKKKTITYFLFILPVAILVYVLA